MPTSSRSVRTCKVAGSRRPYDGFGYFTLSDNRYPDNPPTCERFMADIVDEVLHAVYRHMLSE
jgi:hypothetical protein